MRTAPFGARPNPGGSPIATGACMAALFLRGFVLSFLAREHRLLPLPLDRASQYRAAAHRLVVRPLESDAATNRKPPDAPKAEAVQLAELRRRLPVAADLGDFVGSKEDGRFRGQGC